jgi:hypothetical protein
MDEQSAARQAADRCGACLVTGVKEELGLVRFWPAVACRYTAGQGRHAEADSHVCLCA